MTAARLVVSSVRGGRKDPGLCAGGGGLVDRRPPVDDLLSRTYDRQHIVERPELVVHDRAERKHDL